MHRFDRNDLYYIDLAGDRDERWNDAYGLGREAMAVMGVRCFTCGRKLWSPKGRRAYCDEACRRRGKARRARFVRQLRDMGQPCPFCNCKP